MVGLVLGVLRLPFIILGVDSSIYSSVNVAAGTNIGVSTFGAITAAIRHFQQNNIHLRIFIVIGGTGSVGGFLGSLFTKNVPVTVLFAVIIVLLLYEAYVIIKSSRSKIATKERAKEVVEDDATANDAYSGHLNTSNDSQSHFKQFIFAELPIGFGIGFLGGLVGLILGSMRLPAMISILKMDPKIAIGTNLAASSLMCVSSLAGHLLNGNVDFSIVLTMGPAAMVGGYLGAKYTNRVSETRLKQLIGFVLIVVASIMLWQVFYQISVNT